MTRTLSYFSDASEADGAHWWYIVNTAAPVSFSRLRHAQLPLSSRQLQAAGQPASDRFVEAEIGKDGHEAGRKQCSSSKQNTVPVESHLCGNDPDPQVYRPMEDVEREGELAAPSIERHRPATLDFRSCEEDHRKQHEDAEELESKGGEAGKD